MSARILVVEDSPTQAEAARELLAGAGYEVTVARSGALALGELARAEQPFDLVISDVLMPGTIDGYELCRRIKTGPHRATPVVLLTSLADPLDIINGLESGADHFITKPYDEPHLLERLAALLDTRRARTESRIRMGVEVFFLGRKFTISSEREQILDLLISTFEDAVRQNRDLREREVELEAARAELRRQTEAALEASEERYRVVFERHPQPLWVCDRSTGQFLAVNDAAIRQYGYTRDQFLALTADAIHASDDSPATSATPSLAPERGAPAVQRHRTRDGTLIDVEVAVDDVVFRGRPARLVSAVDVTERERNRRSLEARARQQAAVARLGALAVSAPQLQELLEAACVLVAETLDVEFTKVLELQPPGTELLLRAGVGWNEARVGRAAVPAGTDSQAGYTLTRNAPVVVENLGAERRFALPALLIEHGVTSGVSVVIPTRGRAFGVLGAHSRRARGFSPDDTYFLQAVAHILGAAIDRDVTDRALSQAQRLESIGRLAGGVAHDFNNILTAILAETDFALEVAPAHEASRASLHEIRAAAQRAAALTSQLLAFSRRREVAPAVISLNDIVAGAEHMLRRLISEDVGFHVRLAPGLAATLADPGQVEQVLMNLVVNARDATPAGGTITIETSSATLDEAYTRLHPYAVPGVYTVLAVADTGAGIPTDVMPHIFEPFFTTKEHDRGTGLGLATCYGIVKQSGGHITAYSEPGLGATFRVYLPVASAAAPAARASPPAGASAQPAAIAGTETILLVEDSQLVRDITSRGLRSLGYQVLEAGSAEPALAIAREPGRPLDLVITDLVLPGMNGRELADHLHAITPALPVLYTSGYAVDVVIEQQIIAQGAPFIPKPYTVESLARKVRQLLDQAPR